MINGTSLVFLCQHTLMNKKFNLIQLKVLVGGSEGKRKFSLGFFRSLLYVNSGPRFFVKKKRLFQVDGYKHEKF